MISLAAAFVILNNYKQRLCIYYTMKFTFATYFGQKKCHLLCNFEFWVKKGKNNAFFILFHNCDGCLKKV